MKKYREWRKARNRARYSPRWNWLTEGIVAQAGEVAERKAREMMDRARAEYGDTYPDHVEGHLHVHVTVTTR